jgi:hypothetical protein
MSFSKTGAADDGATAEGITRPFTEEVVSYKHGDNVILHQWAGGGDLLVNCQSPTAQSFICQVLCFHQLWQKMPVFFCDDTCDSCRRSTCRSCDPYMVITILFERGKRT